MRALALAATAALLVFAGRSPAVGLANGSFETGGPQLGLPFTAGIWSGDAAAFVGIEQGIAPFDGNQMNRFIYTSPSQPEPAFVGGELWQLIDMSDQQDVIDTGLAVMHAAMVVDRVSGDEETDTRFALGLYAYQGNVSEFPSRWPSDHLDTSFGEVLTDALPGTWELVETTLCLPVDTDYVAVWVVAIENVFNDGVDPEFDGHYADFVTCELVLGDDSDGDGVPNACESCPSDCGDDDGDVGVVDLLALLGAWGQPSPTCDVAPEPNGDGTVDVQDLLQLLAAWGPCP